MNYYYSIITWLFFPDQLLQRWLGDRFQVQPQYLGLFVVPGIALLLAVRLLDGRRPAARSSLSRLFLTAAWTSIGLAGLAWLVCLTRMFAIVAALILAVMLIGMYVRRRRGEDYALLSGLAIAAEEGIPLVDTARAFAAERGDVRTMCVWQTLAAGKPLRAALAKGGIRVPAAAGAVLGFAEEHGCLGALLRRGLEPLRSLDATLTLLLNRFLQWQFALSVWAMLTLYLLFAVMPVFEKVSESTLRGGESVPIPAWTLAPLDMIHDPAMGPYLVALFTAFVVLPFVLVTMRQCGARSLLRGRPYLPFLRLRYDSAAILHALAAGVRSSIALPELLQSIAAAQEIPALRRRLTKLSADITRGRETWDAFERAGLLTAGEATSLRTADRCGNTAFALDEISQAIIRRLEYRLRSWTAILYPIGLAILGTLITFTASLIFVPLIAWVFSLS